MRVISPNHNHMPSYYQSGLGKLDNSPYGNPSMPSQQGSSSSNHQEQFKQPSNEELFHALKDEINRDNKALLWVPWAQAQFP